jgi:hypothetical protein
MAGESSIFYTNVDGAVQGVVNARSRIYAEAFRSSDAHAWLHQKMAYADASAYNEKNGNAASLALAAGGGIGENGLYNAHNSSAGKFTPKPHITSVKIANTGDFGSVLNCTIAFAVYNLSDLNTKQAFFDLGSIVKVNYGWNRGGSAAGSAGYFEGFVTNFNYSVNAQGGFDCSCTALGKGMSILGVNSNPAADEEGKKITDALGNEVVADSVLGIIDYTINLLKGQAPGIVDTATGIGNVKFPTSWGSSEPPTGGDAEADTPHYYISLNALVNTAVNRIHKAAPILKDIVVKCNSVVTRGNVPKGDSKILVSGNPLECLFPGFGTYGPNHDLNFTTTQGDFQGGDLSAIMINCQWLHSLVYTLKDDKGNDAKGPDLSLSKFLNKVFDMINQNSGTRFKLTLSENPKNPKEFLVVDANYADTKVTPFMIEAVTRGSVCRNISLVSKIPTAFATAAYVGASSALSPNAAAVATLNGKEAEKPSGDPTTSFEAAKKRMDSQGPAKKEDPDGAGPSPKNVNALRAALTRMYTSGETPNGVDPTKEIIPIPLDFSCTLDGVNGFLFGNAVTTNYLPTAFTNAKMCFTVKNVEHNISQNDWTTTLTTICRTQPTY